MDHRMLAGALHMPLARSKESHC